MEHLETSKRFASPPLLQLAAPVLVVEKVGVDSSASSGCACPCASLVRMCDSERMRSCVGLDAQDWEEGRSSSGWQEASAVSWRLRTSSLRGVEGV